MAEVKVDGHWLAEIAGAMVTDLKWSSRWGAGGCGSLAASWSLSLPFEAEVEWLRPGRVVEIIEGGSLLWRGVLSEPARGIPWTFDAIGIAATAGDFAALDASGDPTTVPSVAATQAVARGWKAGTPAGFSATAFGESDPVAINKLDDLLNAWSETSGLRWGVDLSGNAFAAADPTTPRWILDGHDAEVGVADDGLFTVVLARYVSGVNADTPPAANAWDTVLVEDPVAITRFGRREYILDLTKLGLLSSGAAADLAEQQLADLTIPAWVNRIEVDAYKLRELGGVPADLTAVTAGQMVRLFGVSDGLGRLANELALDVVLGEVEYVDGATTVSIAPTKLAARTLADVIANTQPRETASEEFAR